MKPVLTLIPLIIPQPCEVQAENVLTACLREIEPVRFEQCFSGAVSFYDRCKGLTIKANRRPKG